MVDIILKAHIYMKPGTGIFASAGKPADLDDVTDDLDMYVDI